jgi:CheY-like chemotaxis protein
MGKPEQQQSDSVLVIDGDVLVRHAIADYLRNCGYAVIEAATTNEAVTVLERESVRVDAAICAAEAPGNLNPFEFRAWALRQRPELQIALAGSIDAAAQKAAELCEQGPELTRPYDPQGVIDYVRRIVGTARSSDARTG